MRGIAEPAGQLPSLDFPAKCLLGQACGALLSIAPDDEFGEVRVHPRYTYEILSRISAFAHLIDTRASGAARRMTSHSARTTAVCAGCRLAM